MCIIFGTLKTMEKKISVSFYKTSAGSEPVREWLKALDADARKIIGADIKTVEFLWPVGFPQVRKMDANLWEVRSHTANGISRIFFTVNGSDMVLLHAIVKKSQKTPAQDFDLAKRRRDEILSH